MKFGLVNAHWINRPEDITLHFRDFSKRDHWRDPSSHPPISWHSFAAMMKGEHLPIPERDWEERILTYDFVILTALDVPSSLIEIVKRMRRQGIVVAGAFVEGISSFLYLCRDLGYLLSFKRFMEECNFFLNATHHSYNRFFKEIGAVPIEYLHFGYPYRYGLELQKRRDRREGILIGTRGFSPTPVLRRNTLISLLIASRMAKRYNTHVTLILEDQYPVQDLFSHMDLPNVKIRFHRDYYNWLSLISRHRVVLNYDFTSAVGQIAADCGMVNVPCVGGNGDFSRIIWPDLAYEVQDLDIICEIIERLFEDERFYASICEKADRIMREEVDFPVVKKRLEDLYMKYAPNT
jgi:hypothetical protein